MNDLLQRFVPAVGDCDFHPSWSEQMGNLVEKYTRIVIDQQQPRHVHSLASANGHKCCRAGTILAKSARIGFRNRSVAEPGAVNPHPNAHALFLLPTCPR
jgi:hypothetical protein